MYCTRCKQHIREHLDCCPGCNNPLEIECHQCHAGMPSHALFCAQCGTKLEKTTEQSIENNLHLETQRRHLTVMFCDLVGSTGLSMQLDPEDLSELLVEYRDLCMKIIKKWDGFLADFQGDGIMIYFGYPVAHEDDSLRAVYAAFDIVDQVTKRERLKQKSKTELALRIGINSGRAVIGNIGSGEVAEDMGIVGDTPNIAAKLQAQANDNVIVISDSTYRNVQGFFTFKELGTQKIKGVTEQVKAYQVLKVLDQAERFQGKQHAGLNRLTGRADEFKTLKSSWHLCEQGQFLAVAIIGEAGIGKSRLLWSFRQWLKSRDHSTVVFNCSAYHTQTALHPFVELVSRGGAKDKSKSRKRLKNLFNKLDCFDAESFESNLALLIDFIYERKINADPAQYKNKIYKIFVTMAVALSRQSPLLIVIEDLHWVDPTTREFLVKFLQIKALTNIFVVVTTRERADSDTHKLPNLILDPLDDEESADLIKRIFEPRSLPQLLMRQLIDSCNGNPLYLEESARYLLQLDILERDYSKQDLHSISQSISFAPESLHDLFMSRLDRLSTEKWIAQLACAIGRRFEKSILADVAQIDENILDSALDRLIQADIVHRVDDHNQQFFEFKHVLLRDATHDALLRSQRQFIHQKIIDVYHTQQPDLYDRQPELFAYHYTQAGKDSDAVRAWQLAGKKAQRLSANIEAVSHFRKALDLLTDKGNKENRLELLIQMGPSLMAVESWASVQVKAVYQQCVELSQKMNNDTQLFASLRGLWGNVFLRGDLISANKISKQLKSIAIKNNSNELNIEASLSQAMEAFWLGEFTQSQEHLCQVNQLYNPTIHREHAYIFSVDPGVVSLFYASRNLWYLGYPDQALEKVRESIELAKQQKHFPSLSWGLGFYAAVHIERGEHQIALKISNEGVRLSRQHDFPLWQAWGHVLSGYSQVFLDQTSDGLAQTLKGIEMYSQLGAGVALPYFYTLYTRSLLHMDRIDEAATVVDRAIEFVKQQSINSSMPELLDLKSSIVVKQSSPGISQALNYSRQALAIADSQKAKYSMLKILLNQFRQHQSMDTDALLELRKMYEHFSEGQELEELSSARSILSAQFRDFLH